MGIKVLIFPDQVRPKENWLGLMTIAEHAESVEKVIVVGGGLKRDVLPKKVEWRESIAPRDILGNHLVFGLPKKYLLLKLYNLLARKSIFLVMAPGKVTKALGIHQNEVKRSFFQRIIIFVRSLLPSNFCVAEDFDDAMYLASSFGQSIETYLPIGLPKSMYIASEFKLDSGARKKTLLFLPTHRWEGCSSVISKWLGDDDFVLALKDFELLYNCHPHEEEDSLICPEVKNTSLLADSPWRTVDVLVTDYSSIAHDFLAAGGKHVIHITSDLDEFEAHEGKSPLTYGCQFPGVRLETKEEFLTVVNGLSSFARDERDLSKLSNSWIKRIVERI